MTVPLLIVTASLAAVVIALLLFRTRNLQKQLKSFSRVVDVEAHLAACEENARLAIEQQRSAAADLSAADMQLNAIKTAISHYEVVLGPVKSAAELQEQIQRDTAKAKQLSAALGKFENALQLKEFLHHQESESVRYKTELADLSERIGASLSLLELNERMERGMAKMQKLNAALGNLQKASELVEYIRNQESKIQAHQKTLDSMAQAIGAARTVVELQRRIQNDQARIQQMAVTIGGLERLPQLGAYIQQQEYKIQQNNAALGEFAQAIGSARSAAEIAAQVTYFQNYLAILQSEVGALEEARGLQEFGFYHARYNFDSIEEYEQQLDQIREKQKRMLKANTACACSSEWSVNGDKREGKKMTDKQVKLMLRAFNGECDAAVGKARYNNVVSLEKRIQKAYEQINKLGETQLTSISPGFCQLKFEELHLVYEFQKAKEEAKEIQRALKEQMKEEEKVAKEIERACEEAERDEEMKSIALERARLELEQKTGQQTAKLESLVARLENELKDAIDRKAKAIARAQLTKSGHVYVLSNIGTFGDDVYKIGMSRRLEPLERVAELGGASVPFPFDVHAMIYCEDAPALENKLHRKFAERRVNMINLRREFFRVSLDEIRAAVADCHGHVTFLTIPEAAQYRETVALLKEKEANPQQLQIA
jgi:hypothetical protein